MRLGSPLGLPGRRGLSPKGQGYRVLALVTDAFGGVGGISQYNRDFLSALARCDWIGQVIVLPRGAANALGSLPPQLRQLPPLQGRLGYSLGALKAAQAHSPIDVVFCGHLFMAPLAALLAKSLRARLWLQIHGVEAWENGSQLHQWSVRAADLVTSVSRYTRRRLLQWSSIDPARVKVLPNTVDPRFQPGPKPDHLLDRYNVRGKKILMTVSRLASSERYKGQDRVIRSFPDVLRLHPEAIYLLVGDGDDRTRLETLALELGVEHKVLFAGPVVDSELPDYYRLADALVMPSSGEGFGIVFLEAMASGIEVIGGNQDGSMDPLGDGTRGFAINPADQRQLVSAISTALCSPASLVGGAAKFNREVFGAHLQELVSSNFITR